jgi:hypothetical protein
MIKSKQYKKEKAEDKNIGIRPYLMYLWMLKNNLKS